MEIHRNLDSNLKYICKICSAQYGRSFALSDHLKSAHPGMINAEQDDDEHYIIEETQSNVVAEVDDEIYSVVIEPT